MRPFPSLVVSLLLALAAMLVAADPAAAQLIPGVRTPQPAEAGSATTGAVEDPVRLLLTILQDDRARGALVEQLQAATAAGAEAAAPAAEQPMSVGRRIATFSQETAEGLLAWARNVWSTLGQLPQVFEAISAADVALIVDVLRTLLLTIVATVAAFTTLRAIAIPYYRRLGQRAAERPAAERVRLFLGASAIDFAIVFLAWAIGYAVALKFFSGARGIDLTQVLYLNAFLIIELIKATFRMLLSPATGALRPLHLSDWAAHRLYWVLRIVTSLIGYGLLLILPIVHENAGVVAARSMAAVIWILAIAFLTATVFWYRRPVGDWLLRQTGAIPVEALAPGPEGSAAAAVTDAVPSRRHRLFHTITHGWHLVVLVWLGWLLLTVLSRRPNAVVDMLAASGKVVLALIAGFMVSGLLGRLTERGFSLPHGVTARVPLLEMRLNRYVPAIVVIVRVAILAIVVGYAFRTLDLANAGSWLASELGLRLVGTTVSVLLVMLVAFAVWLALNSWVDYRLNPSYGTLPTAREQTLLTLLRNAATIAILVLALMFVLSEIGLNIGPLIASAGVVGLAIGFGAQKLVQDIINGIFIQFENAINVGDVVSAGGITGAVERMTVRSVSLRDVQGTYHLVPFSSVDTVSNLTRDFSFCVIDMRIAYREQPELVRQAMSDAFEQLRLDPEQGGFIVGDFEWFGVEALNDSAVVVRARIKTWPGRQWGVGRAYNELVKRIFEERDIHIPFPQQTVWAGESRDGPLTNPWIKGPPEGEASG